MAQKHLEGLKTIRVLGFDLAFASPTGWALVELIGDEGLNTTALAVP